MELTSISISVSWSSWQIAPAAQAFTQARHSLHGQSTQRSASSLAVRSSYLRSTSSKAQAPVKTDKAARSALSRLHVKIDILRLGLGEHTDIKRGFSLQDS